MAVAATLSPIVNFEKINSTYMEITNPILVLQNDDFATKQASFIRKSPQQDFCKLCPKLSLKF